VNAIPSEAWMEVDLRSADAEALAVLGAKIQAAVDAGVAEENRRWKSTLRVTVTKELVGDRPAGSIAPTTPIVRTVQAAGQALLGVNVPLSEGSTDANLPLSLNIPAVTIGGGGEGDDAHATSESFNTADSWKGTQNAVLVTIALSQR
jgi:acetylornithine deacetylase/succinyl-diaminopimelate desuccinylase-like protein